MDEFDFRLGSVGVPIVCVLLAPNHDDPRDSSSNSMRQGKEFNVAYRKSTA